MYYVTSSWLTTVTMTSQQIQALLAPPDVEESNRKALLFLNSQFRSLEDLDELETATVQAQHHSEHLKSKVRLSYAFGDPQAGLS
jgi:hypothetical protein